MFIPTTAEELQKLGWDALDVVLISGDTYIDSPYSGVALIGQQLLAAGYKVGIIAQPSLEEPEDITRLGEPKLFWGISAGTVDSMVANTTALGKPRKSDDHTPGGLNNRRPDRASIVYSNLIRRFYKQTVPIVLGGVEASLRRVAHYDFWTNSLRRSILLDAKADFILYGMADLTVLDLAEAFRDKKDPRQIRGLVYTSRIVPEGYELLPSFEEVSASKEAFTRMFHTFYQNNDPISAVGLAQSYAGRFVIQTPPAPTLTTEEMDAVYNLPFEHAVHPYYAAQGEVRAMDTIRNSIPTHRGCYGECNFCAIAVHEGRRVSWRSQDSVVAEAERLAAQPGFRGIIQDLSGPTANMYGFECAIKAHKGACQDRSCIYPEVCPHLKVDHKPHEELLRAVRQVPGVRKVFVASGIRHDLLVADKENRDAYMRELVEHHVSGQLRLAPEHSEPNVLALMRKPGVEALLAFKRKFEKVNAEIDKEQFLSYYLIAAHPGSTLDDMIALKNFALENLGVLPEQVQIFTPTPSTYSTLMYYTGRDPFTGEWINVERGDTGKMQQKAVITGWRPGKTEQARPRRDAFRSDRPERKRFEDRPRRTGPREYGDRKPGEAEAPLVRSIKDEYGHFFNNKKPEGWIERPKREDSREGRDGARRTEKRWRPAPGDRGERPGYRSEERREEKRPWNRDASGPDAPRGEGGKPDWRSRDRGTASDRPRRDRPSGEYKPDRQRSSEDRPPRRTSTSYPRGGTDARKPYQGDKPYRRDDRGEQGSAPRRDRPEGRKPYSSDRRPSGEGKRPYGDRQRSAQRDGRPGDRRDRPRRSDDRNRPPRKDDQS